MLAYNDVVDAINIIQMFCSEKESCTKCPLRHSNGGNAYYCGITRNVKFAPVNFDVEIDFPDLIK